MGPGLNEGSVADQRTGGDQRLERMRCSYKERAPSVWWETGKYTGPEKKK